MGGKLCPGDRPECGSACPSSEFLLAVADVVKNVSLGDAVGYAQRSQAAADAATLVCDVCWSHWGANRDQDVTRLSELARCGAPRPWCRIQLPEVRLPLKKRWPLADGIVSGSRWRHPLHDLTGPTQCRPGPSLRQFAH